MPPNDILDSGSRRTDVGMAKEKIEAALASKDASKAVYSSRSYASS